MKVRLLEGGELPIVAAWIAADPEHAGMEAGFFQEPGTESYVVEDESGPVYAFRVSRTLRIDIQFQQGKTLRTARGLKFGFDWLIDMARGAGYKQLLFDSKYAPLIAFCKRKFGFRESGMEFIREL